VRDAIADSCNTFFWHAVAATPNATSGWGPFIAQEVELARALGFGAPIGVGLREEKAGASRTTPGCASSTATAGCPASR
jgi:cell division protein FtsI/penicillin-binding protein 2